MQDTFAGLGELPVRRYIDVLRNRANDLSRKLDAGAYYDQHPGKQVPWVFSTIFGPIQPQVPRNIPGAGGATEFAPLVAPARFITPQNTNILTGRDAAFYWCSTNVVGLVNWTFAPGTTFPGVPVATKANGGLFDTAIENNGGAQIVTDFTNAYVEPTFALSPSSPLHVCFEIDIYDKKRGRSITDGRIPAEAFLGLNFENKLAAGHLRFDPDTELEPRVYITAINGRIQGVDETEFNFNQISVFLNIAFCGYNQLEEPQVP